MTNLTQPSSPRKATSASGSPLRGSLKGALAILVLLLLALLFWQVFEQFRHTQADRRQQSLDASAELASQLNLSLALNAQKALTLLQPYPAAPAVTDLPPLLEHLHARLPALRSLVWVDAQGALLRDSAGISADRKALQELLHLGQERPYYFSNSDDNSLVYLLLQHPDILK